MLLMVSETHSMEFAWPKMTIKSILNWKRNGEKMKENKT